MGLIESVIGRNEVHQAMNIVNTLIKAKNLKRILCGWEQTEYSGKELYYFLTQPEGLPLKTIAQNSKENNSIFISSSWRSICNDLFRLTDADSVLRTHALVFVVLHELGHIIGKIKYQSVDGTTLKLDSLILRNKSSMEDELFADFFAADLIKNNSSKMNQDLIKDLEELYTKVDYYYFNRYEAHGGGLRLMLSEPAKRFGDLGYTHPNLNLRMHLISYLINPTGDKLRRLIWIQEQRKLFSDIDTFTPDVMDGLIHLKNLPDEDSSQSDSETKNVNNPSKNKPLTGVHHKN